MEFVKEWTEEYLAGAWAYACSFIKTGTARTCTLVFNSCPASRSGGKVPLSKGDWRK